MGTAIVVSQIGNKWTATIYPVIGYDDVDADDYKPVLGQEITTTKKFNTPKEAIENATNKAIFCLPPLKKARKNV